MPRPTLIVVPTDSHFESALREAAEAGSAASVRTAHAAVADALATLAPERALASPHATRIAARDALEELAKAGLHLGEEPLARTMLAHAIDDAIGTLRRAGATPGDVRDARRAAHSTTLVADAWDRIEGALGRARLLDARGAGGVLAGAVARADEAGLEEAFESPAAEVRFRGRLGWTADDLVWIEALHRALRQRGGSVTIELPRGWSESNDDVAAIADELERRWASLPDAPEIDWVAPRHGTAQDAAQRPAAPAPSPITRVVEGKSSDAEARGAVASVLAALDRSGAPERIVVVVPDLDEARLEPLRRALGDAGVPFTEPRGRPIATSPDARTALALLTLAAGPIVRDELVDLLRAPGLHPGAWFERASERAARARAAALAQRLRELPVRADGTGQVLLDALAGLGSGRDDWMPRALGRILASLRWLAAVQGRAELVGRFLTLLDTTRLGNPSAAELALALRDEALDTQDATRKSELGGLDALGDAASAVRAMRGAARALAEAAAALGTSDASMTPLELAAELERSVAYERRPSVRAGALRIVRPSDVCGMDLDLAVVTGLDGPSYGGEARSDPLLDERLCAALPAPIRPQNRAQRRAQARAELAWVIAGAREVTLCWASARLGEETAPDTLIRAAASSIDAAVEPASRVASSAAALSARGAELAGLASGSSPPREIAVRADIERARTAFFQDPRAAANRHTGALSVADTRDRDHLVTCIGGSSPERAIAVTHIERAMGCAFAGFARRVLHVRRIEDAAEAGDPRERGTMLHRALHAAFEAARPALGDDPERALALARGAAAHALALEQARTPLRREAITRAVADAVRAVAHALRADEPVHFYLAEQKFGPGAAPPWQALELTGDDGRAVYVEGQIDRIDRSTDGRLARVVDYKTGKKPELVEIGVTALQLPLYAAVVARALGAAELSGAYVRIASRGAVELVPEAWEKQRATVAARSEIAEAARRRVLALFDGDIAPRPVRATLCTSCDARDVCRRPAVAPIEEGP